MKRGQSEEKRRDSRSSNTESWIFLYFFLLQIVLRRFILRPLSDPSVAMPSSCFPCPLYTVQPLESNYRIAKVLQQTSNRPWECNSFRLSFRINNPWLVRCG